MSDLGSALVGAVPFAGLLGITITEITDGGTRAVAELADDPRLHNHVGGPHAGALFTLAETASGAIVIAALGHLLDRSTPLAVRAEISYKKFATGDLRATAVLGRPVAEIEAEFAAGERPEFSVAVEVTRGDGVPSAELTVVWTLRPHRPA